MNTFNVSVKAKLFATLALAGVVMVAVGVLGLSGTKNSNGQRVHDQNNFLAHLDSIINFDAPRTGYPFLS